MKLRRGGRSQQLNPTTCRQLPVEGLSRWLWPRDSSVHISTCAQILESNGSNVEKASLLCQSRHKRLGIWRMSEGSKSSTRWVRSTKVPLLRLHLMRWWREDKPGSMLELSSLSSRLVRAHAEWECLETMDRSIQPLRIDSPGNSGLTL